MNIGLLTGFLCLMNRSENWKTALFGLRSSRANHADRDAVSAHEMRDLGMLDGRVSPSTIDRSTRSGAWDLIESRPHSL